MLVKASALFPAGGTFVPLKAYALGATTATWPQSIEYDPKTQLVWSVLLGYIFAISATNPGGMVQGTYSIATAPTATGGLKFFPGGSLLHPTARFFTAASQADRTGANSATGVLQVSSWVSRARGFGVM